MTCPRPLAYILLTLALCVLSTGTACGPIESAQEKAKGILDKLRPDDPARPCFEHEECFAGEYCAEGVCAPYTGRTVGRPVDRPDLAPYLYDLGDEMDMDSASE